MGRAEVQEAAGSFAKGDTLGRAYLETRSAVGGAQIVEVFSGYIPPTAKTVAAKPLPSATFEIIAEVQTRSLQLIPSRFDFSDNLLGAVRPDPKTLARYLTTHFQHKDLIIIDCSPTESILTTAAHHASGRVLVPVKPEYFATIGFPLQQSLDNFRNQNRAQTITVAGLL